MVGPLYMKIRLTFYFYLQLTIIQYNAAPAGAQIKIIRAPRGAGWSPNYKNLGWACTQDKRRRRQRPGGRAEASCIHPQRIGSRLRPQHVGGGLRAGRFVRRERGSADDELDDTRARSLAVFYPHTASSCSPSHHH